MQFLFIYSFIYLFIFLKKKIINVSAFVNPL